MVFLNLIVNRGDLGMGEHNVAGFHVSMDIPCLVHNLQQEEDSLAYLDCVNLIENLSSLVLSYFR